MFLKQLHYFGVWSRSLRLVPQGQFSEGHQVYPGPERDPHCHSQSGLEWVEKFTHSALPRAPLRCWAEFYKWRKGNSKIGCITVLMLLFFFLKLGCTKELRHLYLSLALLTFPEAPSPPAGNFRHLNLLNNNIPASQLKAQTQNPLPLCK